MNTMTLDQFKRRYLGAKVVPTIAFKNDYNLTKNTILKKWLDDEYEKNKKLFDAGVIDIETYAIIIESINQMKEEELKQLDAVVREVYF
jgi:serine protease inhibitor